MADKFMFQVVPALEEIKKNRSYCVRDIRECKEHIEFHQEQAMEKIDRLAEYEAKLEEFDFYIDLITNAKAEQIGNEEEKESNTNE